MFKKVHLRLTLLCAGSTAAIMIIMSLCYLYVSERSLYRNQFQSFENDINTITTNLEHQTVISMEWLSKMESQDNYLFFVIDNGIPFLYNQLSDSDEAASKNKLLEECLDNSQSNVSASHYSYTFTSPSTGTSYIAGIINMGKASSLEVIILFSLESLKSQIREQRFRFALIDVAAV
ncbi:MAG: hypothetical protein K2N85_00145, partial [Lachnospiraceae bacterium]|nr:hypothetical protein [Lachnospiraceae bacterium]